MKNEEFESVVTVLFETRQQDYFSIYTPQDKANNFSFDDCCEEILKHVTEGEKKNVQKLLDDLRDKFYVDGRYYFKKYYTKGLSDGINLIIETKE